MSDQDKYQLLVADWLRTQWSGDRKEEERLRWRILGVTVEDCQAVAAPTNDIERARIKRLDRNRGQ